MDLKRLKRKINGPPNPLFESWLKGWRDEAKKNNSEMQYTYNRALKSLQKFPFKLETGKECFILEHFGAKICMMLDKRLEEYKKSIQQNDIRESKSSSESDHSQPSNSVEGLLNKRKGCMDTPVRTVKCVKDDGSDNTRSRKGNSMYLPAFRSGGYALLITLHGKGSEMTKGELEKEAQKLSDASFKKTSSESYYTAWSSMNTLVKKGLVEKNGKPIRYSLTDLGKETVKKMQEKYNNDRSNSDSDESLEKRECSENELISRHDKTEDYPNFDLSITFCGNDGSSGIEEACRKKSGEGSIEKMIFTSTEKEEVVKLSSDIGNHDNFFLLPNEFSVLLYVDTQEIENKQNVESDKIVRYLKRRNVNFEVKHLNVGDYLWVCRDASNRELVLPYIVERKRMDDLGMSIRDGRFHEQKFRLKHSGIPNCIYLVEKYGNDQHRLGLPLPTIQQAITNTRVIDGFDVKITSDHDDSLSYLTGMTNMLTRIFKNKTLMSRKKQDLPVLNVSDSVISLMNFQDFNKDSSKLKKFTVRSMLVKHLLQLNGLSVEKAKAIVKSYPTPRSLMEALRRPGGESLVAGISCGALNRSVGTAIAKSIHQLFTLSKLH